MSSFSIHVYYVLMASSENASHHDITTLRNYEADNGLSQLSMVDICDHIDSMPCGADRDFASAALSRYARTMLLPSSEAP
jgi:hypothetical protein